MRKRPYGKSWGLKDYLEQTRLPLVVVGLECNHEGNLPAVEFSPYDFADPVWGEVQGQGELLLDWMSGELKEWVDENLPVLTDREHTFIGGSSMGGLMALYAGGRSRLGLQPGCLPVALSGIGHGTVVRRS